MPRARLHEETIMGRVKRIADKKMKLNDKVLIDDVEMVVCPKVKAILNKHFAKFENNPKLAFTPKTLKKNPVLYKEKELKEVVVYEWVNTKRVNVESFLTDNQKTKSAKVKFIENVKKVDKSIGEALECRLAEFDGNLKEAFKNLNENPIIRNNGMTVKDVTIYDESKIENIRTGVAKTGGNHHALIYKDKNGKFNDRVVSFWEAVAIGLQNLAEQGKPYPIINRKNDDSLGIFQFSMQINDLFIFNLRHSKNPQEEYEIDFFDKKNRKFISDKLFRVQKMTKKSSGAFEVTYRHHLEANLNRSDKVLKTITWDEHGSNKHLERLTKVRVNHLGEIIKIGE